MARGPILTVKAEKTFEDGTVLLVEDHFDESGRFHRIGAPARLVWPPNNAEHTAEYFVHGEYHREDGPALIRRYADGSVLECYYNHGKLHRDDGPAHILRRADGGIETEQYWHNGHQKEAPPPIHPRRQDAKPHLHLRTKNRLISVKV
jgi:hypothetical protein